MHINMEPGFEVYNTHSTVSCLPLDSQSVNWSSFLITAFRFSFGACFTGELPYPFKEGMPTRRRSVESAGLKALNRVLKDPEGLS